jgi:hypothetical protein
MIFIGTIMTISKDRVKPSPMPDSWKLAEIFATGIILGGYLAMMTVIFFWVAYKTNFFPVSEIVNNHYAMRKINQRCHHSLPRLIKPERERMVGLQEFKVDADTVATRNFHVSVLFRK